MIVCIVYIYTVAIQSISPDNDISNSSQPENESHCQVDTTDSDKDEEVSDLPSEMIVAAKSVQMKFLSTIVQLNKILKNCDSQLFLKACSKLYAYVSDLKAEPLILSKHIVNLHKMEDILNRLSFLWSWHNYSVLKTLLKACNCQEGLTVLDEFESQIDLNLPMELFPIPRLSPKMVPSSSNAYTILSIKTKQYENQQVPLQYITEVTAILGKMFGLTQHALQLLAVQFTPLVMHWIIPNSIVSLINREIHRQTNALECSQFLEITTYPNIILFSRGNWSFSLLNCDHPQVYYYVRMCRLSIYVTGFGKTCIVHTSNFAHSKIHKIW